MNTNSIELEEKDEKEGILTGNIDDFDVSELKNRKKIRIIILVSVILFIIIIALIISLLASRDYCDKGDNEKCQACKTFSKDCKKCNPFFKLKKGKCIFAYSFEAIYKISKNNEVNETIKLFNDELLKDYKIKIQIEGEYFEINKNYYNFTNEGENKIRINLDIKNNTSLEKMFKNINELKSISFTNDFNTNSIQNMNEMFSSSKNLISICQIYLKIV